MGKRKGMRILALLMAVMVAVTSVMIPDSTVVNAAAKTVKTISIRKPATKALVMKKGTTYKLKTSVSAKQVNFKSSKPSVVSVTSSGKLKAKKKGSATIIVSLKKNKKVKTKLTVKVGTKVSSVRLNTKKITIEAGKTYKLKATVKPKKATIKSVSYKSGKTSVATVTSKGVIKGISAGRTKITVTSKDGNGKKAVCTVIVKAAATPGNPDTPSNPDTPEEPKTADYKIEYYQEKVDGNYELADTVTKSGTVGETVETTAKVYLGFSYQSELSTASGTVTEDGKLVLKLYYKRNSYTITYNRDGGSDSNPSSYRYGVGLTLKDCVKEGSTFDGWYKSADFSGEKVTVIGTEETGAITLYAKWIVNQPTEPTDTETEQPDIPSETVEELVIPEPSTDANAVGAVMPYTRYDSRQATLGGGASLVSSADFNNMNIASQASEQSYVTLPSSGSYAEWRVTTGGDGVTMRFTLPDTSDGMGQNGSLDVYVNGTKVKTVNLTSYYMWQYFSSGHPADSNDGGKPCFAFDETHFRLNTPLKAGDTIRIQSTGANSLTYGVDFLEIEETGRPIAQPANSYSVLDYGAAPDDGIDDYSAISACIAAANKDGKDVYIPAGTYHIGQIWRLYGSDIKITGAGMWYTNIQFTSAERGMGGISGGWTGTAGDAKDGYCKNVEFCNMYINSNLRSRYNQEAVYKCFMDVWDGAVIHDIWEEHFECGFWFGDYNGNMNYGDNAKVVNCRIRNNLADGVNFCMGTSNSTVYNCSIRNNGDDGLAMWNDSNMGAKDESNNVFCYNTIDFIWRAGGIAIYGGNNHKVYNNYIADTFMSAGIHLNTTFNGYKFSNCDNIEFSNNVIVRSGTTSDSWNEDLGAIDIKGEVKNITFNNTRIYDAQHEGLRIWDSPTGIVFNDTKVYGAGVDGQESYYSSLSHKGAVIKFQSDSHSFDLTLNRFEYANIGYTNNEGIYGSLSKCNVTGLKNLGNNYSYSIPGYQAAGSLDTKTKKFVETKESDVTVDGGSSGGSSGGGSSQPTVTDGPDLTITDLKVIPEDAKPGDQVKVQITIKNQGTQASPAGTKHGVAVCIGSINWTQPSLWSDTYYDSIPVDGEVVLTTNGGNVGSNGAFTAQAGRITIGAYVDDQNLITETNESNNTSVITPTFTADGVTEGSDDDTTDDGTVVSKNATVEASSSVGSYGAENIADGDLYTYWESAESSATVTMKLAKIASVNKVTLYLNPDYIWSARTQKVEVLTSLDGTNYTSVKAEDTYSFDPTTGNKVAIEFADRDAVYIRLKMSDNTGSNGPQLAQLVVSGDDSIVPEYADLTVTAATDPEVITIGDEVKLQALVKNEGGAAVPAGTAVTVSFEIGDNSYTKEFATGLAVGETKTVEAVWTAENVTTETLTINADVDNAVIELDENNNSAVKDVTVNPVAGPDVVVLSASAAPGSPSEGEVVSVAAIIKNQGNAATTGAIKVNAVVTSDENDSVTLTGTISDSIGAGETASITLSQGADGQQWIAKKCGYTVVTTADVDHTSGEDPRNAVNNTATSSFYFGRGASMPFTVTEAEDAANTTNGTILEKNFKLADYAGEASGRSAVQLKNVGDYVEFTLGSPANAFVLRSAVSDGNDGTISLYVNGTDTADFAISTRFSHVYTNPDNLGQLGYQNSANSSSDQAYWLYEDSQLLLDTVYPAGTKIRIQKDSGDVSEIYVDLLETENVAPAAGNPDPDQYIEVSASKDISTAVNEALANNKKGVFIPAGKWELSGKVQIYNRGIEIVGAGPWHTKIVAPESMTNTDIGFNIQESASGTVIRDLSAWGNYVYRVDGPGKFIDGSKMSNVTIENVWAEHFICLYWGVGACNNTFKDCRIKNIFADGINMTNSSNDNVITNCYARATGDDSFALFSASDSGGSYNTGNDYSNLTAVCPRRAACFAIYGGSDNTYTNLYGADTLTYPGITISSLSFGYQTKGFGDQDCIVDGVTLDRCGGDFWGSNGSDDHINQYQNFAAIWVYAGDRDLKNVVLRNIDINDAVYFGIMFQSMYNGSPASDPMSNIWVENVNINNPARYGIKLLVCAEAGQGPCVGEASFKNVKVSGAKEGAVYGLDKCPNFKAEKENCNW